MNIYTARPLTLTEKILRSHTFEKHDPAVKLEGYVTFRPDRVAMQDATAQMALLQFITAGKDRTAVPASVHCDHLICARDGEKSDIERAFIENAEVYEFLATAASRYGIDFWKPGAGIIHHTVLENYAFPGGMMVGTDSHTPNAGGLGMLAIGVGGADAVDVMAGLPWELKVPKIIGVKLNGKLSGWASPKDVILKLAGILTTKGGTNSVIEYFGDGAATITCTGKATICNMGAEVGATCSVFPFDESMAEYLRATGREKLAEESQFRKKDLAADPEVYAKPEMYYDRVIEINLDELEPMVNGPFTPDAACPVSKMRERVAENSFPDRVEAALIGSCTNSSYQDLAKAAAVVKAASEAGLKPKAQLIINPGSTRIKATAERDGIMQVFKDAGALIMCNACGPCIGQWERKTDDQTRKNTIVTSFNRNFAKRADGNPNTHAFIVSPHMAVAYAYSGSLGFNPQTDSIGGFRLPVPESPALPERGFMHISDGLVQPVPGSPAPIIRKNSERLQFIEPFDPWDGKDITGAHLLIKVKGKCTTDHISMAGPWLRYRGHLENISENLLLGATDAFTGKSGPVAPLARRFKADGSGSVVVAEDNYGEGSSREHAAMEQRYLGVRAILAKSFARIHETNLKKQGVLALSFANPADWDKVRADDFFDIGCAGMEEGKDMVVTLHHSDGSIETIKARHSYNGQQIGWFKAGSALNSLKK